MLYLHYWFANSGYDAKTFNEQSNKTTLRRQLREYKNIRRNDMTAGSTDPKATEVLAILEKNVSGMDISEEIAAELQGKEIFTSSANSGIGNFSFQQIGTYGSRITAGTASSSTLANQLISDLSKCQDTSQKALSDIIDYLKKSYPDAITYAINQYATTKQNISSSKLLNKVLTSKSEILEIDTNKNFTQAEKNIIQTYARLQSSIDLIPSLGNVDVKGLKYTTSKGIASKGKNIKDNSHLISIVVGKIGGNLSYLGGFAYEIAAMRAAEVGLQKVASNFSIFGGWTGGTKSGIQHQSIDGKTLSTKVISKIDDALIAQSKKKNPTISFNKNDASFVLTDDKLIFNFGGTIKKLGQPEGNPTKNKNIKLQESKNLQTILDNARKKNHSLTKHYIYSLASGRETKENNLGTTYNGSSTLAAAWRSLVDYAVTLNFLDFLAGNGTKYNNNALFIVNNKIWSIEEILEKIVDYPSAISYDGGKQRYRFYKSLKWIGIKNNAIDKADAYRREKAKERSSQWETQLNNQFNSTILTIKLNIAALSLI